MDKMMMVLGSFLNMKKECLKAFFMEPVEANAADNKNQREIHNNVRMMKIMIPIRPSIKRTMTLIDVRRIITWIPDTTVYCHQYFLKYVKELFKFV